MLKTKGQSDIVTREDKMTIMREAVPRLRKLIEGLSAEQLTTQYNAPEWTIAQNIHHLADTHLNCYIRFKMITTEEYPTLAVIHGDRLADLPDAQDGDVEPSLIMLHNIHLRWTNMMQSITDWSAAGYYPRLERDLSLGELLDFYSEHCNMHYKQIQEVMDKMP